jgi:acetyl-CoA acetyltransferase
MANLTAGSMLRDAAVALSAGLCDTVLCVSGDTGYSNRNQRFKGLSYHYRNWEFEEPYGPLRAVSRYALIAKRHMIEFGTTAEQLAKVAVMDRQNASLNPSAQMRTPITVQDVLNSRKISEPFHLLDCSLISDGGCAFIVGRAKKFNHVKPVYIRSFAEYNGHEGNEYTTISGARVSGRNAMEKAGLKIDDLDVAYIYDSFTITPIILLEDLGFCKKGEGGKFVENTDFSPRSNLPLNTHGGLLSQAHPGFSGGMLQITEALRQLRNEAGPRQARSAKRALVHICGGTIVNHFTVILSNE